ncbi:hypothetical protein GCM10028803_57290 [Larkinella knui]
MVLFFTDDLELCINRAKARYLNGGHEVRQEVIEEMYTNTFPLFEENKNLFHQVRLVDVTYSMITELMADSKPLPKWVVQNTMLSYL